MLRTAGQIGIVHSLEEKKEEWTQYFKRLELFFAANGHANAGIQNSILLTAIGPMAYKCLSSFVSPDKQGDKPYSQLVVNMKFHHSPTSSKIVQRFKFNWQYRYKEEIMADFVAELPALAEFYNCGKTLKDMLRDWWSEGSAYSMPATCRRKSDSPESTGYPTVDGMSC